MKSDIAIVGDIHGNASALEGMLSLVEERFSRVVFVGDYVNRGPDSSQVLQQLIALSRNRELDKVVFLAGNHDESFLSCLENGNVPAFLQIGGAATIQSYLSNLESDILAQLRRTVPEQHVEFLRSMSTSYRHDGLCVSHGPHPMPKDPPLRDCFHVYGHVVQGTLLPNVTRSTAAIDTGCGTLANGRLTCIAWPSLHVIQVEADGRKRLETTTSPQST